MFKKLSIVLFAAVIGTACERKCKETTELSTDLLPIERYAADVKNVVLNNEGIIRGIDLGQPISVLEKEVAALENQSEGYAYFQGDLNDVEFYDIEYFSIQDTLTAVEMEIFGANDERTVQILVQLEEYFDAKYGKSVYGFDDYRIWNTKNKQGNTVAIGIKFEFPLIEESTARVKIKAELSEW